MNKDNHKILVVDGMGGDDLVQSTPTGITTFESYMRIADGIRNFYIDHPRTKTRMLVTGRKEDLEPYYESVEMPSLVEIVDVSHVLPMDLNPTDIHDERHERYANIETTIQKAYEIAKGDENACVVSIGNTIGLVYYAKEILGMVSRVRIPCLIGRIPCEGGYFYGVDLGANPAPKAPDLLTYAVAAEAHIRNLAKFEQMPLSQRFGNPRVGLFTYGTEAIKANSQMKRANIFLSNWRRKVMENFNFVGNVEPYHLSKGKVELAVGSGDYMNILIKTMEASIPMAFREFKRHVKKTARGLLGGALLRERAESFRRERMSPEVYSGALLLLVSGYVVKAHGTANVSSISRALEIGEEYAGSGSVSAVSDAVSMIDPAVHCDNVLQEHREQRKKNNERLRPR